MYTERSDEHLSHDSYGHDDSQGLGEASNHKIDFPGSAFSLLGACFMEEQLESLMQHTGTQ